MWRVVSGLIPEDRKDVVWLHPSYACRDTPQLTGEHSAQDPTKVKPVRAVEDP